MYARYRNLVQLCTHDRDIDTQLFVICTEIPFISLSLCHLLGIKLNTVQLRTAQIQQECGYEVKCQHLAKWQICQVAVLAIIQQ